MKRKKENEGKFWDEKIRKRRRDKKRNMRKIRKERKEEAKCLTLKKM